MEIFARSAVGIVPPRPAPPADPRPSLHHDATRRLVLADGPRPTRQASLATDAALSGRGLHTGRRTNVWIVPAPADHGIVFRRRVGHRTLDVPALWTRRVSQPLCTSVSLGGSLLVRTVEHLLATLSALAIDNALVALDGEELPIFDGSAAPWCNAVLAAGRQEVAAARRYLRVTRPVRVEDGGRFITIEPFDGFSLDVRIALKDFGAMRWHGQVTAARYVDEIAPSRSFGRLKWAVPTKLYGLVTGRPILRGAHLGSTAAIWGGRILGGMRVPDEPVRHRALDLMGDLSMAVLPILGHVTAKDPGHEINHAALAALMRDRDAWEIVNGDA